MVDVQSPPRPRPPGPAAPRQPRWPVVALVMVIVAGLVGIGVLVAGGDEEPSIDEIPVGTDTSVAVPTTPTTIDPQAATRTEILDAYRQSTDAVVAVGSDPTGSPADPRLEEHKIGNALLASKVAITRLRNAGHVLRGDVESHPTVVELTTDTAVVEDCALDQVAVVNASTGEVVEAARPPGQTNMARATYRLIDGVWMQNSFKDLKQECIPVA